MVRRRISIVLVVVILPLLLLLSSPAAAATEKVKVLIPDRGNLQYMSFWVAKGAGYFAAEGIEVDLAVPPAMQQTEAFFERREAEIAVLAPPMYVRMIAGKVPLVLVANLLANDPISLIVRRSVLVERKLSAEQPIKERLEGLRGVKLGVAPHPPTRLRALYAWQGLDADKDLSLVILHGKEQNAAFHGGEVDALYAHTPYLEHAIVEDDAVVLVDQCKGEVPSLANRQIHTLVVQRSFLEQRKPLVTAFVRAIAKAQALIHRSHSETVDVLAKEMPDRNRKELETIVRLYEPAIPKTPLVRAEDIPTAVTFFPAGMPKPDLTGIDLTRHVQSGLDDEESAAKKKIEGDAQRSWRIAGAIAGAVVLIALLLVRQARRSSRAEKKT